MKVSHMLLWILGTTLLAFYSGIHCWGGHQRGEGVASFADVLQLDPVDWLSDAHAEEAAPVGLAGGTELHRTVSEVGVGDSQALDGTGESMRTIVTCYPSQFIGYEPARVIVRAAMPDRSI